MRKLAQKHFIGITKLDKIMTKFAFLPLFRHCLLLERCEQFVFGRIKFWSRAFFDFEKSAEIGNEMTKTALSAFVEFHSFFFLLFQLEYSDEFKTKPEERKKQLTNVKHLFGFVCVSSFCFCTHWMAMEECVRVCMCSRLWYIFGLNHNVCTQRTSTPKSFYSNV